MMTVDELIKTLDSDGDGLVSEVEWLENLRKCVGLAHQIADIMDENGDLVGIIDEA